MVKIEITSTVSFKKKFVVDTDDYPEECKTLDDVVAMEKTGLTDDPMSVVDGGELTVNVTAKEL